MLEYRQKCKILKKIHHKIKTLFYTQSNNIFGIKKNMNSKKDVFIIINTAFFGDILLCNSLSQNIKICYPNSKVVFITGKNFADAAIYQKDVDEVYIYDKNNLHKGIFGMFKFLEEFPYRNVNAIFLPYSSYSKYILSLLIGAKKIVTEIKENKHLKNQHKHTLLLSKVTDKEIKNLPIKYETNGELPQKLEKYFKKDTKYIAFCPISKRIEKDIPINTAKELINLVNDKINYKIIFCGAGQKAQEYSDELEKLGCNFIDLTNQTTIPELASVIKNCIALISVDTGTMHLGCALDVPTAVVFYEDEKIQAWGPDDRLYKSVIINSNQTAENILNKVESLLTGENNAKG